MSLELTLFDVTEGSARLCGRFQEGDVIVGRSSDAGVCLTTDAVSFEHGMFSRKGDSWFFKDLKSTNGSSLNGETLNPHSWYQVRGGDVLQVGDAVLEVQVSEDDLQRFYGQLLVLKGDEFVRTANIDHEGVALLIGGSRGEFPLTASDSSRAALIFEFRADGLSARGESGLLVGSKNGREVVLPVPLCDRDQMTIGDYQIFVRLSNHSGRGRQGDNDEGSWGAKPSHDSWDGSERFGLSRGGSGSQRARFGELGANGDEDLPSLGADGAELAARYLGTSAGGEGRPLAQDSLAFLPPPPPRPKPFFETVEGRLIVGSGVVFLISALTLMLLLIGR